MEYLEKMIDSGTIILIMTFGLVVAFVFKMLCSFCYDEVIDKIKSQNFIGNKRIKSVIDKYNEDIKSGRQINNTEYYLRSELHKWKYLGLYVDKINNYGNIVITICLIIGGIVDLLIISDYGYGNKSMVDVVRQTAVYTFIPLIFLGILKLYERIVAVDYKKKVIFDELLNYISNPRAYVKLTENHYNNTVTSDSCKHNDKNGQKNANCVEMDKNVDIESNKGISKNVKNSKIDSATHSDANKNHSTEYNENSKHIDELNNKELVISQVLDEFL